MPKNQLRSKAIRARMVVTGETFHAAERALNTIITAHVIRSGGQWGLRVDDPREHNTLDGAEMDWDWSLDRLVGEDRESCVGRLDDALDCCGWERAPGSFWPEIPDEAGFTLALRRSSYGGRKDLVERILQEAGASWPDNHGAYIRAVAYEATRHGLRVVEAGQRTHGSCNERRGGFVTVDPGPAFQDHLYVLWDEGNCWSFYPVQDGGLTDLNVDLLARPTEVVAAMLSVLGLDVPQLPVLWTAPDRYDSDPNILDEELDEWMPANPAVERALVAYLTYPVPDPDAPVVQ